jgi:hypothetical protein
MAEPSKADVSAATGSGKTSNASIKKNNAAQAAIFTDFLRTYSPEPFGAPEDAVENQYHVDISQPLHSLDTSTATAYAVKDGANKNTPFYALVLNPGANQRFDLLKPLGKFNHPNMVKLVAHGVIYLTQLGSERYVLIYTKPEGKKLSEILENTHNLGEQFIIRTIIRPLADLVHHLEELDIHHGCINPDSIYFKESPVLTECISEPCGHSQTFYYEPLEHLQTTPAGKSSHNKHDFYALGVLIIYMVYGAKHFSSFTRESLIEQILREGTYYALTRNKEHPEVYDDFLRGVLSHNTEDRWKWRQIKPSLTGKRFNVLPPARPADTVRGYKTEDHEIVTRREMAHYLFTHWTKMPAVLRDNQFMHWIGVSQRNKSLAEQVERSIKVLEKLRANQEVQFNEQLMRIILLLDPNGPVRMSPLCFFPDALGNLTYNYYLKNEQKELNLLMRFYEQDMVIFWLNVQKNGIDGDPPPALMALTDRLDKMRITMRSNGPGFGIERVIYEMNPYLPCMSPLLEGKFVGNMADLLRHIDIMSPQLINKDSPIDNHIFAYLACNLGIQHDVRLHEMEAIPGLSNNRDLIALKIFAMAQYRSGNICLPGLCHWLALRVLPVTERFKSKTVRKEFRRRLKEAASTGYSQVMAKEVLDPALIAKESSGYANACSRYYSNFHQIRRLKKALDLESRSRNLGLLFAKFSSLAIFLATVFSLFQRGAV